MVVSLLALVVLLVAAERLGRSYAEGAIADRLRESGVSGDIDVSVGSSWWRPAVLPALVTGDLDQVRVQVRDGSLMGVPIDRADYTLSGISGDVSVLDGTVAVSSIERGDVAIDIPPKAIADAVESDARIRGGRIELGDPPTPVRSRLSGDDLLLEDPRGGAPLMVPVADPYVLPCKPVLHVGERSVGLRCSGRQVPGVLRGPLQGPAPAIGPDGGNPGGDLTPPQSTVRPGG